MAAIAEQDLADEWSAKLGIAFDSEDDREAAAAYPEILALLPDVPPPAPEPAPLPELPRARKAGAKSPFWWLNVDDDGAPPAEPPPPRGAGEGPARPRRGSKEEGAT